VVEESLNFLHGGQLAEIRALNCKGRQIWGGYFRDYGLAAKAAKECERAGASGVYTNLNVLHPGLYARAPDVLLKPCGTTTSEHDILSHQWLFVDVDPIRPSDISSTDAELERAEVVSFEIFEWAKKQFRSVPRIWACSGNGYHILVRLSAPKETMEDYLKMISSIFSDEFVKIDQTVFKSAQMIRLYGTIARKGFSILERPHRLSRIIRVSNYGTARCPQIPGLL
jgi:hypothetical protein